MNFKNFIIYIKKNNKTVTYYLFKHVPIFKIQLDDNTRYIFKFLFFKFKIRKKDTLLRKINHTSKVKQKFQQ